jgi:ubiquinone/menaquinone biosynthesis C-methylase UbiE
MSNHPSYQRILSFLKEPESQHTLLDLGCCFAQGIRKLVYDGVPSENLYACDLKAEFLELGYELFKDKDTLRTHCFAADVFQPGGDLEMIEGKIDVIHAANFFHLFSWNDQIEVAKRVIRVLKPQIGSLVFGRQIGTIKAREMESKSKTHGVNDTAGVWSHDTDSFRKLWEIAGNETGTRWKTWVELDEGVGMNTRNWAEDGLRRLRYEVERLE